MVLVSTAGHVVIAGLNSHLLPLPIPHSFCPQQGPQLVVDSWRTWPLAVLNWVVTAFDYLTERGSTRDALRDLLFSRHTLSDIRCVGAARLSLGSQVNHAGEYSNPPCLLTERHEEVKSACWLPQLPAQWDETLLCLLVKKFFPLKLRTLDKQNLKSRVWEANVFPVSH